MNEELLTLDEYLTWLREHGQNSWDALGVGSWASAAQAQVAKMKSLGYRKIPELTLIGDEEINKAFRKYDNHHRAICQAQLDHDNNTLKELEG